MNNIIKCFLITAAILAAAACTNEVEESPMFFSREMTFKATREGVTPDTKTVRMDDGSTWWNAKEEISVFYGSGSNGGSKFVSQNNTSQAIVEFSGSLQSSGSGDSYWAVYPYSQDNECDGNSVILSIPRVQVGVEGNFSDNVFPAVAKSETFSLGFRNVCGGIKFSVSRNDIKYISFKGLKGETLTGKVKVTLNADGVPVVTEVLDGKSEVTLIAPEGGTFKAGKYYYISMLPTALNGGFMIYFDGHVEAGVFDSHTPQTIKRSTFGVLKNIDSKVAEWESTIIGPWWVDLGLSVKWASYNVGANKPEEYGDYFAWGETEPKSEYSWSSNKWCDSNNNTITKYNNDSAIGTVDNKAILDVEDDVAYVSWGGSWRMPTLSEQKELLDNCTWTWTSNYNGTGVAGHIVTSQKAGFTDKSIFLPVAGIRSGIYLNGEGSTGYFWSSSLDSDNPRCAYYLYIDSGDVGRSSNFRYIGLSVRPVYDDRIHPESITLNKSSITLFVGDLEQLISTILPTTATDKSVTWSSDNTEVATVDEKGNVNAVSAGTATITVTTNDGNRTATCVVTVDPLPEPEAIDLGLSVKWASFNVGATKSEDYGDYFAWGETVPYYEEGYAHSESPAWKTGKANGYHWLSYSWWNCDKGMITRYCPSGLTAFWGGAGAPDGKTEFKDYDYVDDAAHANWGGNWRTPTDAEWKELLENCTSEFTTRNGINGRLVTSNKPGYTDKSIFLPASGFRAGLYLNSVGAIGFYWSSSVYTNDPVSAFRVNFDNFGFSREIYYRFLGYSVRPVSE